MFSVETFDGKPLTREIAELRASLEPIIEATQIKGDSEAHPMLSPNDEFADYETWDRSNLNGTEAKKPEMLQYEYTREALKTGLKLEKKLGVNPFKFGMIGSTDAHTSLATTREDNTFGKLPHVEPNDHRAEVAIIQSPVDESLSQMGSEIGAAGLAGVWARENTRESLFDAMTRKEVYATTGSRISVRVFGGWDFTADEVERPDFAERGYRAGVPMGGDLSAAPNGAAPRFMIRALRDPDNANLDRVQVIKGWLDDEGNTQEKVYDVAWSGNRSPNSDNGKLPVVGNTVDVANASWTNTIGATELITVWKDPDFDPQQRAFYYARVIEIPTPRWTAYDAKYFGLDMPDTIPMTTTERAYTSPIWYSPE